MSLEEAKAILAALVREHVEFVVIGSMAMAAQGLPRATHDLDLNDPNVDQIDPGELAGDYPAVEYTPDALPYEERHRSATRPCRCRPDS
jgi:hypothetical protein